MDFARALRTARAARGISQQELAQRVEVKPGYISMLERGERKNPSTDVISRIARALRLPVPLLMLLGSDAGDLSVLGFPEASKLMRALLEALAEDH